MGVRGVYRGAGRLDGEEKKGFGPKEYVKVTATSKRTNRKLKGPNTDSSSAGHIGRQLKKDRKHGGEKIGHMLRLQKGGIKGLSGSLRRWAL